MSLLEYCWTFASYHSNMGDAMLPWVRGVGEVPAPRRNHNTGDPSQAKWIEAGRLIELLSQLDPDAVVVPNDQYNLAVYAPGGLADEYLSVINIRAERFEIRGS